MDCLRLVIILFGEHDNIYIRNIIKHNAELLKPGTLEIWGLPDLDKYAKERGLKNYFKNMDIKAYQLATDSIRVSIILDKPNTLYIDADMLLNNNAVDLLFNNLDRDLIFGWKEDGKILGCSGTFLYHGNTKGITLRKYLDWIDSDKHLYQSDIDSFKESISDSVTEIYNNQHLLGYSDDLFIAKKNLGLHTNASRLYPLKSIFPSCKIGYVFEDNLPKLQNVYRGLLFILYEVYPPDYNRRVINYNPYSEYSCFFRPIPYEKNTCQYLLDLLYELFPDIIDFNKNGIILY